MFIFSIKNKKRVIPSDTYMKTLKLREQLGSGNDNCFSLRGREQDRSEIKYGTKNPTVEITISHRKNLIMDYHIEEKWFEEVEDRSVRYYLDRFYINKIYLGK